MTHTIEHAPARSHRVTRKDAVAALTHALPALSKRQPALWRDVQRAAYKCARPATTSPAWAWENLERDLELMLLSFCKCSYPGGHIGRVPELGLSWNLGVRICWDAVDEREVRQLVVGVWHCEHDFLQGTVLMGSVRTWQGNSALKLVHEALKVLAEESDGKNSSRGSRAEAGVR